MATFPALTTGGSVHYGTARGITFATEVIRFQTAEEQRWAKQPERATLISIELREISSYDLSNIRAFYIANVGPLNCSWDLTLDGVDYTNLAFEADGFNPVLSAVAERWNLTLKVRQTA